VKNKYEGYLQSRFWLRFDPLIWLPQVRKLIWDGILRLKKVVTRTKKTFNMWLKCNLSQVNLKSMHLSNVMVLVLLFRASLKKNLYCLVQLPMLVHSTYFSFKIHAA